MKTRYIILKKYDENLVKVDIYKYFDGETFAGTIAKAFWYESQRDAHRILKTITEKGIFQIEPVYCK